jgi:hypothetical protein
LEDWEFYLREMYNDKKNYLKNENRKTFEIEVINYLKIRKIT